MSKTESLHYQLCLEGAKWLRRRKHCSYLEDPVKWDCSIACKYIAVELCTYAAEHPDVWGYDGNYTAVIEVKVSHADFLNDRKKWARSEEAERLGYQAGNFRWYLCPEGIIKPEEVPEDWGLLYWDGKKVQHIKGAPKHKDMSGNTDMRMLYSILRREKFPEKIYNYRHQNTTIKSQRRILEEE